MKNIITISGLLFIGFLAWRFTENISSDALSMALGLVFGVLAGIPAALMVLAGQRRDDYTRPRQGTPRIEHHEHNHFYIPDGPARRPLVRQAQKRIEVR